MNKAPILKVLAASLLAMAGSAHAMLVNGSFEDPVVAAGTYQIFPSISGWTTGSLGIELRNDYFGEAYEGDNYAELDTTANSLAYQDIATTANQAYTLSFAYSPRMNIASASNGIEVFWEGGTLGVFTGTGIPSGNNWSLNTFTVIAIDSSSMLEFKAVGTSDSYGGSLDAVSLTPVPEPEAYGLALAGMGVVAFAMRRRQPKSS